MDIFKFDNYQEYLCEKLDEDGVRGRRATLGRAIGSQTSFISQVLTERAHFTLEQALKTSKHLGHSKEEKKYFILLVEKARSGSSELEDHFSEQLSELKRSHQIVRSKINVLGDLEEQHKAVYYSSWKYCAIHVLTAFPGFQSIEGICKRLGLTKDTVISVLDSLVNMGLVVKRGEKFSIGKKRIHLDTSSNLISTHHQNWRNRVTFKLDEIDSDNLHYSSVLALSKKDARIVKEKFLDTISQTEIVLKNTEEEEAYTLLVDFLVL